MKTFFYTQIFILNIFLANFASAQDQEINILDFLPDVFERSLRTKVIDVFDNYYSFIYPVCANTFGTKIDKVDLETDLRGSTRLASKCPTLKYQNPCPTGEMTTCQPQQIVIKGNPSNQGTVIDTSPQHLRSCQMFRYKPTPLPEPMEPVKCNYFRK